MKHGDAVRGRGEGACYTGFSTGSLGRVKAGFPPVGGLGRGCLCLLQILTECRAKLPLEVFPKTYLKESQQ